MSTKTIATILNLKDNFSKGIKSATNSTKAFQKQIKLAENQADKMRKSVVNAFTGTTAKIAGVLGGISLASFAKDSLMLASDLSEVQNVVDTTFGSMSKNIDEFAKTTSSKFGISELQAKQYSGTLGAIMKSSGIASDKLADMSTNLAGLAGDMASFYNLEPDVAFEKLKSAISGETEPMKALGVNMSVTNMEAYALSKGIEKAWKNMSQAEQTTLRYNYLLEYTKDSQGDYIKTNTSFANSLRTLKLNFQTLGANIMVNLIPTFERLFASMNDFITKIDVVSWVDKAKNAFNFLKNHMRDLIAIASGLLAAFVGFFVITKVVSLVNDLRKGLGLLNIVFSKTTVLMLTNPLTWVAVGIGVLVAALVVAYQRSEQFRQVINNLFNKLLAFGQQAMDWARTTILPMLSEIGSGFMELWNGAIYPFLGWLTGILQPIFAGVFAALGEFVLGAFDSIGNIIEGGLKIINGIIDFLTGVFTGNWTQAWNGIKESFSGIVEGIKGIWQGLINFLSTPIKAAVNITKRVFGGADDSGESTSVAQNALGTNYFRGGYTWVGERGPELMKLPGGTQIKTNSQSKQLASGDSSPNINITIQGNVIGNENFIDQLGNAIYNKVSLALVNS